MGKGSRRRKSLIGREEEELRYALAFGDITAEEFENRMDNLRRKGLITRDGKIVK
jgi:hypothetical protein